MVALFIQILGQLPKQNSYLYLHVLYRFCMAVLGERWRKKGRARREGKGKRGEGEERGGGREGRGKRGEEKGVPLILRYCATRPAMCIQQ